MTDDLEARVVALEAKVETLTAALEAASWMQLDYDGPRIYMRKRGDLIVDGGYKVRKILADDGLIELPQRDSQD